MTIKDDARIVFLDQGSLFPDNLNWKDWSSFGTPVKFFSHTLPSQVDERIKDATVVVTNKVVINQAHIRSNPKLQCICVVATGTNNIDLQAANECNVVVCHARDYGTESVAQHTWMLILALSNRLLEYQRLISDGRWSRHPSFALLDPPKIELTGKVLGIVGLGTLGRAVADKASTFGMRVCALKSHHRKTQEGPDSVTRHTLDELLQVSDVLSLHCPLDDSNRHFINSKTLRLMKSSAFLINTARGGLVDHDALLEALREGIIAGAALDTLDVEPPPHDHPVLEARLPNLIVTPHNAWGSQLSRQTLVNQTLENIQAFLSGTPTRRVQGS